MRSGIRTARPHLAFLVGLTAATAIMWKVREVSSEVARAETFTAAELHLEPRLPRVPVHAIDATEREQARVAWRYFERNYVPETGLVNAADNYPSTSLWDLGSYMMAIHAARSLGIIDAGLAHERLARLLDTLARLPLVEGLPNKVYNTRTLAMVDYNNAEAPLGVGWSAIDIARLSVPLTITVWSDPDLAPKVRAVLGAWRLDRIVAGGELQGAVRRANGKLELVQEGRLGYEQYAAGALALLGLDVERARRWDLQAATAVVSGQPIVHDARSPARFAGTHNAIVSEPFLLGAFELGLGDTGGEIAEAVYRAQANHAREVGHLVAVSEDNIDRAPYFVYNSVLNGDARWAAFAPDGSDASAHRTLSTKAAFGWSYLYGDAYARQLRAGVAGLYDPERGWYSGTYDANGATNTAITANTNGIILETLWHATRGPLLDAARR